MSAEYIIRHGAPTLAGLKTGNLFPCSFEDRMDFQEDLRTLMILLFTLLNLPLLSIDHLTQRFVEMFSSAETWSNMELWRKK